MAATKDKSLLYKKYPQLVSSDTNQCVSALSQMFINLKSEQNYEMMWQSGMHGLNDLGSLPLCEQANGVYSNLALNMTYVPATLISGLCLPKECTPAMMDAFMVNMTEKINTLIVGAQKKLGLFNVGPGIIQNFTRMQGRVLESQYQAQMWVDQTNSLFKWVVALLVVYVVCLGVVPAIIIALMNIKNEKVTAAAAVPLTASETSGEIKSELASSLDSPHS
jgi:hypothetical protein